MDPSSGWREVARVEGLLTYVLIKVIIVLYVASRRVRSSIVIIEKHSTQQYNTCDDGPYTSTYDQPTTNPLRVEQGH